MSQWPEDDDLEPEYDFSGAVRGEYYQRYQQGTNVVEVVPNLPREDAASGVTGAPLLARSEAKCPDCPTQVFKVARASSRLSASRPKSAYAG